MSGSGTALLCLMVFANTVCVGAFGPLLPEIARAQSLADWQLGLLAGSFGFARMIADVPTGLLAGRRLGTSLAAAPALLVAGVLLLWSAGPFPVLVLGRVLVGLGHSLGMVAGLTAILLDQRGAAGSMRLNVFEFAGMAGVLGWPRGDRAPARGMGLAAIADRRLLTDPHHRPPRAAPAATVSRSAQAASR